MGQWDNRSSGEKKLPYPPAGEPWETSGAEAKEMNDDHFIIWGVSEGAEPDQINVGAASGSDFHLGTLDVVGGLAKFTLGASAMHDFTAIDQTYAGVGGSPPTSDGGRVDPVIHTFHPNIAALTAIEVGLVTNLGPPMGPMKMELAIWVQDSQGVYFKKAHMYVMVVDMVI